MKTTKTREQTREERLEWMMEKGRVETGRAHQEPELRIDLDLVSLVLFGVIGTGAIVTMITRTQVADSEPPEPPRDIWSFLVTRTGRLVIEGVFNSFELFLRSR